MEGSDKEQGLLSSPGSLLETVHHLLLRGAHGSNPIQCMCMRMRTCACLKSVSEATPCSFGCWCNCGVEIKGALAEWCSRGDFTTQPSPLCRGGRLLLTAPLSPLAMHCPLHIPARKKWLRLHLSCVYDWEALRDREWHLQESIKRLSPLSPASVSCLEDYSTERSVCVCVCVSVRALLIMWWLQSAQCWHLYSSSKTLCILQASRLANFRTLSFF